MNIGDRYKKHGLVLEILTNTQVKCVEKTENWVHWFVGEIFEPG